MDKDQIQFMKKKYRANAIPRLIVSIMCLLIFYYFKLDTILIAFSVTHLLLSSLWLILVEAEVRNIFYEQLRYFRIFMDLFIFSIWILVTGGINSFGFLSYAIMVGVSSFYETKKYAYFSFVLSVVLYNGMLLMTHAGIISPLNIFSDDIHAIAPITVAGVIGTNFILVLDSIMLHISSGSVYMLLQKERLSLKSRNEIIESDLALAKKIQDSLVPSRQVAQYIHSLYKPMDQVGGDFFDFIQFKDSEKIGIFISDVSGHGVPAALITSMLKTVILQSGEKMHDPAALLLSINDVLKNQTAGNFITAFYGIYDPTTKKLLYANAGHPQPYIIAPNGIFQLQKGKNTALAMFPNDLLCKSSLTYINYEESIPENSKLVLYTDGFVEARPRDNDESFFEYTGMLDTFTRHRHDAGEVFLHSLYDKLVAFRGTDSFEDDVCLICLDIA